MASDPRALGELTVRTALEACERALSRPGPTPAALPALGVTLVNGAHHVGRVLGVSTAGRRIVLDSRDSRRNGHLVVFDTAAIVSIELHDVDAAPDFLCEIEPGGRSARSATPPRDPKGAPVGLEEKRALKKFQDETFPVWKTKIDEAAGLPVALEIAWETLMSSGYAHLLDEALVKVFFEPLRAALSEVARDELGREALKGGLKRVVIKNSGGFHSSSGFGFTGGALTLDHDPVTNMDDVEARRGAIVQLLNEGL